MRALRQEQRQHAERHVGSAKSRRHMLRQLGRQRVYLDPSSKPAARVVRALGSARLEHRVDLGGGADDEADAVHE
eukprot:6739553-Prymnesium_polylepis.1